VPSFQIDNIALRYRSRLAFAGSLCELSTNSAALAATLQATWSAAEDADGETEADAFTMRALVIEPRSERQSDSQAGVGRPHFRGLQHIVIASFGGSNVFIFDQLRRTVSAAVSEAIVRDTPLWRETMLPITVGVLGAAIALTPIHCACLGWNGGGLLVAGASGAGKSTLAVALAQCGLDYIADDWTYVSLRMGKLAAHGASAPVKLLPDAVRHYPILCGRTPRRSMNGELAYEVDAADTFGARVVPACEPRWLVFLERRAAPGSEFSPMPEGRARAYLEANVERLPAELHQAAERRARTLARIAGLPCWRFRYGGSPQFAAGRLLEMLDRIDGKTGRVRA
jgi:hypothetical protein